MNKLILTILTATLIAGCSNAPQNDTMNADAPQQEIERTVTTVASTGELVSVADLSISGMSCEMMCGGAIKQQLAKLPGVVSTEIAFNADEDLDHAIVTYDESQVSDTELASAVGELHDGQYQVKRIAVERHVKDENASEKTEQQRTGRDQEADKVNASIPIGTLIPSLIEILSQIVRA